MDRRTFLKIFGMGSVSFSAGCTSKPEKTLYSLVHAPDDMVTGKATWYASTCRECPAGCGLLAKNREGRVIKVEGNPLHPINRGKLCMRGQASVQGVFNPDRVKRPLLKKNDGWQPISFQEAESVLKEKIAGATQKGENKVYMLTEVVGRNLSILLAEAFHKWRSQPPHVFEPYAYESLRSANQKVFGLDGLASYRMEEADFLLSFGADFLETWLSPVEYARKFKGMHSLRDGKKGFFVQVGPYQSLTCANADLWLSCHPDAEIVICLGLINEALQRNKGQTLPPDLTTALDTVSSPFIKEKVVLLSGVDPGRYEHLLSRLKQAERPLVLGTGTGGCGSNSLKLNVAVNVLNALLDPGLSLFNFHNRHRAETAARRSEVAEFFQRLQKGPEGILLINNVNPLFALSSSQSIAEVLKADTLFTVSFSNFLDETSEAADLILPVRLALESWDEYSGTHGIVSMVQPAMASLTGAPHLGDLFLGLASSGEKHAGAYQQYLFTRLADEGVIRDEGDWAKMLQEGGVFGGPVRRSPAPAWISGCEVKNLLGEITTPGRDQITFFAAPSIRFFDGRGANRPWLCEVPDPLTRVAWQSPLLVHSKTLNERGLKQGDMVELQSPWGVIKAPLYETAGVMPGSAIMSIGQGHEAFGRYAKSMGVNPLRLLPPETDPVSGSPLFTTHITSLRALGEFIKLAHTDGSRIQHDRKIALSIAFSKLEQETGKEKKGLGMWDFPFTLPLPEGYDKKRDVYPAHGHDTYRWALVVDLDRCIGCNACASACYAENNLGVVGVERIIEGREMAWLSVERYLDPATMRRVTFLPMLCQHCDNAPCESVCPVFAPHHSKEGLNNQIYNRCIGTRFCAQNCPYKVRRFNWFDWKWPSPLNLQLNPDVTVRSKGVMEKCSFCVQRIKDAHGVAKDENRRIRDGEVQPACVQTCPPRALIFGNLMDEKSEVRRLIEDRRAYQVMGYLNTKPAVVYLRKVVQEG